MPRSPFPGFLGAPHTEGKAGQLQHHGDLCGIGIARDSLREAKDESETCRSETESSSDGAQEGEVTRSAPQDTIGRDEEIEARCARIVEHYQAIGPELHAAAVKVSDAQQAMRTEEIMARREWRRPQKRFAEAVVRAEECMHALRYDRKLLNDEHARLRDHSEVSSQPPGGQPLGSLDFQGPPEPPGIETMGVGVRPV